MRGSFQVSRSAFLPNVSLFGEELIYTSKRHE